MIYELEFLPTERLREPRVPASALHGMPSHYKIKLRTAGFRLVYRVEDSRLTVVVVAVGKREKGSIYETAKNR
jgi:mRNA interferase RelE/StbE